MTPSFVDEVYIWVKGGNGGAGCASFRREKYVPHGGPDGGDGGNGGAVYLVGKKGMSSLYHFRRRRHFRAERGYHGQGRNRTGRSGRPLDIEVPLGTVAREEDGTVLCEILEHGGRALVARGGRAGRGNARFKSSTNQAPRKYEPGEIIPERSLKLELKLLADVAIIGLPNSGKSTLISRLSAARPKIAEYPFTTVVPNLGVVAAPGHQSFVVADVPGLIEGASEGHGMGVRFLRHVERSRLLVHLLDASVLDPADPAASYRVVRRELEAYDPGLARKPELVALNKCDLNPPAGLVEALETEVGAIHRLSAVSGEGVEGLVLVLWRMLVQEATIDL